MTRDQNGRLALSWREIGSAFFAMLAAATIPVSAAMVVMYGDVREIKSNLKYHGDELERHDRRITVIENRDRIEQ